MFIPKANTFLESDWFSISKTKKYKKQDFDKLLEKYFQNKKEIYTKVKSLKKEERNFGNTVLALENCSNAFDNIFHQIGFYSLTHQKKEYRDLVNNFEKELAKKSVDIEYDKDIYRAIVEYKEGNYRKEKKNLDREYGVGSVKLFEDIFKGYERMGFNLPKSKQNKLKSLIKKLSEPTIDFSRNIDEYRDYILCSKEETKGLPEIFLNTLEKVDGQYKITLEYPDMSAFLKYADSREKRKELVDKNYKRGGLKNLRLLEDIVELRDKKAKLLGYRNHVDYSVENRMIKSEVEAKKFVESLIEKLKLGAKKELLDLNKFSQENLKEYKNIKKIFYYDQAYIANKLKEKKYNYESANLKEYFELEHTLKEIFSIFGELFSFTIKEVLDQKKRKILPAKEVRLYEFKDKNTKKVLAFLILDLFPREGKYTHAGHTRFLTGLNTIKIDAIICNFAKPSKTKNSLLSLDEVETFFHELGHALHSIFSKTIHFSQSGTNCDHDFVEVPSQLMENFLFEKVNLKRLAVHYKTKKPLDVETIQKIINGRNFLNSLTYLRQLIFAKFDLDLHSNKIQAKDSANYFNALNKKYFNFDLPKDAIFPAGFGHLMGYDAGYYSYMWALVYADDFYSEFKKVLDDKKKLKEVGERYRREILEVGGSRKEMESAKKFLERKSNNKAFLKNMLQK